MVYKIVIIMHRRMDNQQQNAFGSERNWKTSKGTEEQEKRLAPEIDFCSWLCVKSSSVSVSVCRSIFNYLSCLYKLLMVKCSQETAEFQMLATIDMMKATDFENQCHELDDPAQCMSSFTLETFLL